MGSFVFASGIVSQEARKGSDLHRSGRWSRLRYVRKSLGECVPMVVLGLVRLLSVKGSGSGTQSCKTGSIFFLFRSKDFANFPPPPGYHEHVTEYGVHWNFFFTLALCKAAASSFFAVFPVALSWPCALLVRKEGEGNRQFYATHSKKT